MSKQDLSKIKGQTPISIIIHGGNFVSFLLAKTLLEQGSHVVIIDKYTNNSKQYFSELKKTGKVSFIDFKGLKNFYEKIARIDYLYYMLGEKVEESESVDSKDFLSENDYLNSSLIAANKYKAKISLITSLRLNRELSNRVNNEKNGKTKPYSPLELQRYGENFAAEFVDKTKANLRIIRLGTIIGKGVNEIRDKNLNNLFIDATQKPQIEIDGEGLELHNLIHQSDAIYGILKLTFSDDTKGEVISLCNKNDYTTLSIAYKLLELDVESNSIKFVERDSSSPILHDLYVPAPNATQFGWKQNITLEDSIIEQIQAYYEKSDKKWIVDKTKGYKKYKEQESVSNISKTKLGSIIYTLLTPFRKISKPDELFKTINYSKIFKNIFIGVLLFMLIYFFLAPLIGISIGSLMIYRQSQSLKSAIYELDFDEIKDSTSKISKNIERVENSFDRLYWLFDLTNSEDIYNNINQLVIGTKYISESTQDLLLGLRPLGEYVKDFEPAIGLIVNDNETNTIKEYGDYLKATQEYKYLLKEGIYKMSLAENLITTVNIKIFPPFIQDILLEYKELITNTNDFVKPLENISQFLPDILGVESRKRYLILLQDNAEIRSTGGWIPSYAVIAIEGGQIRELFVDDIYNAEATLSLQGHTYRAPNSLVRALPDTKYSFPLVNWNPNLDNVLISSEQFIYDLGQGNSLDGLITVDLVFIQKLLDKWGGIEVPGETELITSENLYSKIIETGQDQSPQGPRNTSFLTDLFDTVITKFFSSKLEDYKNMSDIIGDSLEEKHIQLTFKNTIARTYTDENGWDGNLDPKFKSSPINIDWNWGVNKTNLYTKKNHTLDINIVDENTVDYTFKLDIQNESTTNVYPEGEYINYIRMFIPYTAKITGVSGFENNEYDIYNEGGHQVIGGWFNTSIKEINSLEIQYRLLRGNDPLNFVLTKSETHYEMDVDIYKQPGSRNDAYSLSITFPETWIIESSDSLTRIENNLNRRFELFSDQYFYISWQR